MGVKQEFNVLLIDDEPGAMANPENMLMECP
jgi:hypothetical protein